MYSIEHLRNSSNDDSVGEMFLMYGFSNNKGEFLGFENGEIILEFDTIINKENTKKLYRAMKSYYEKL